MVRKVLIFLILLLASLSVMAFLSYSGVWDGTESIPRDLSVGDTWAYKVLFPDGKSYQSTETVIEVSHLNGTDTYVIFRDDDQHISTQYLWFTSDWREVKTFKPHIGNLLAKSTVLYRPPLEVFRIPFHVGDRWFVNSTLYTITEFDNKRLNSTEPLIEVRETTSSEDLVTPAGRSHAFKVTVRTSGDMISEALWFDARLGQVVYGEFYDQNEKVTQTLVGFKLASPSSLTAKSDSDLLAPCKTVGNVRLMSLRKLCTFASYIYHNPANSRYGVENI